MSRYIFISIYTGHIVFNLYLNCLKRKCNYNLMDYYKFLLFSAILLSQKKKSYENNYHLLHPKKGNNSLVSLWKIVSFWR